MMTPGEKVDVCDKILNGFEWKFMLEEIDRLIQFKNTEISDALAGNKIEDALRLAGEKKGLENMKLLPKKVRYDNLSIVNKAKELLSGNMPGK